MKIYVCEELGCLYWLDENKNLNYSPLMGKSALYNLSGDDIDGGIVEYEVFEGEKTADGKDITEMVREIERKLGYV